MAIAVKTERSHVARTLVAAPHALERELDRAGPGCVQVRRDEIVREQPVARLDTEASDAQAGALYERRGCGR
jgi:hypothetical protein